MGWLAIFLGGGADEAAAVGEDFRSAGHDVGYLDADAGPGALAFTAAVDADGGTGELELAHDGVGLGDLRAEDGLVEGGGSCEVCCPDDVFDALDKHDGP